MRAKRIMIIAGEASGDLHGAKLVQSLKKLDRNVFVFGIGGSAMQAEGVSLLVDSRSIAVVGITEVLTKMATIRQALHIVRKALRRIVPDLLILIDFPDFNFQVAGMAKKRGIPILYYISPQIWAWRQGRVKTIKRLVDHMAVIFPFEAPFYRKHRVPVTFVGHPLLDRIRPQSPPSPASLMSEPVIGLLPGSREKEVATLLPGMLEAAAMIKARLPSARFVVSCAGSIDASLVSDIVRRHTSDIDMTVINGPVSEIFKRSHLLVAASGTVTLEAALHCIPTLIVYKVSPLSYWLGKRLIRVKHIGIVNLIVDKPLLPELIQDDASARRIADTAIRMITNDEDYHRMTTALARVRHLLGGAGASDRVARIAMDLI